ncbi:OsmC family protein [Bradyrhizobium sp. U87765 SZCCT0131]|uniref:OsmC family protein n=1 Tax=unclassified Bradyrhizobium TaxID=2631580 RepID=UPI001BA683AA|nr:MULTISPECIES: OsmC family protein [unclassified Bradyrhizobium]MBR1217832.1 OsmC family protein [Bradyrhizobium sp. U87765 SZCCT0131]MBR1261222.1 OsmC family protein [Bradyrhizobium sp. U87765 SZCCT0134]MBR1303330.1 OsmC family protein [Bradyrhizobium sp. U87765 SZCCT0110]MBR1318936.1 OsmC family protein [Bradyrhizobium sp. U87765 SZCCT0109]MBR1347261.1 OsmC family protein [Bradyrhizobium sp. U87765 SZCCT0048]
MPNFGATIVWQRAIGDAFADGKFSRRHVWQFDGGAHVPASASPHIVPPPLSAPADVDPEEAYVAALSSCHMLTFLYIAASHGFVVDSYRDEARGTMQTDDRGHFSVTRVTLTPVVTYGGPPPDRETEAQLHQEAHAQCFLANSVRTMITIGAAATI